MTSRMIDNPGKYGKVIQHGGGLPGASLSVFVLTSIAMDFVGLVKNTVY